MRIVLNEWINEYLNSTLNIFIQKRKQIDILDFQRWKKERREVRILKSFPCPRHVTWIILFPPATSFLTRGNYSHFLHMETEDHTASKHYSQNCSDGLPVFPTACSHPLVYYLFQKSLKRFSWSLCLQWTQKIQLTKTHSPLRKF